MCPLHTHTQADQSCYGFKMHTDVQKHTCLPKCKHVALSINNTVHQEFKPVPLAKTSLLLDLQSLLLPPFTAHFQLLGYRLPRTAWANCVAMVIMPILSSPNSLLALLSWHSPLPPSLRAQALAHPTLMSHEAVCVCLLACIHVLAPSPHFLSLDDCTSNLTTAEEFVAYLHRKTEV